MGGELHGEEIEDNPAKGKKSEKAPDDKKWNNDKEDTLLEIKLTKERGKKK